MMHIINKGCVYINKKCTSPCWVPKDPITDINASVAFCCRASVGWLFQVVMFQGLWMHPETQVWPSMWVAVWSQGIFSTLTYPLPCRRPFSVSSQIYNLLQSSDFIQLYCLYVSNRDYPSWASQRPWCLLQRCHAPVATSPVRFDRLLWGSLRPTSNRRSRRWWRGWNWDQPEHWWQSIPETSPTRRFQHCQANRPEAWHDLHRHTDPGVQWTIVQCTLCHLHNKARWGHIFSHIVSNP